MKRTRNIRLDRFRKVSRVTLCIALPIALSACDGRREEPFSTISQCQQQYNYTAQQCRQIYAQAVDRAKLDGKAYMTREECIRDNRNDPQAQQQCQYTSHGSAAHFFYVPRYYSYSPGGYAQPFYRSGSSTTNFRSAQGKSYDAKFGGRSYTRTTTRGGFGSTPSAHVSRTSSARSFGG